MKHLLTICAALLLTIPLHATEYVNQTVRFSLPDDFIIQPTSNNNFEGFEATNGTLRLTLFTLRFPRDINLIENLRKKDISWFPFLDGATQTFTHAPIGTRYERVSDYLYGDQHIRIYRYVAARSLCFLIAENADGNWTEADQIAKSQRYQKNFAFFLHNLSTNLILGLIWISVISGICILISNLIKKRDNRQFWYWIIPTLLLCAVGIALFGWPLSLSSLTVASWVTAMASSLAGGFDDDSSDSSQESDADLEDPSTFDGTGPTIDYKP